MKGSAHAAIGGAIGFAAAYIHGTDAAHTLLFIGLGTVSALVPDLDTDGKLRGRMTLSHQVVRSLGKLIGLMMIIYSFIEASGYQQYLGMAIGLAMLTISSRLKQKHMLMLTSVGVITGGISLQETWLFLFGLYILLASFVSHRTYTHSLLGVVFFAWIALQLEASLGISGVFSTCLAGYISHLAADSKLFPVNRRGVKLFLPFSTKEI